MPAPSVERYDVSPADLAEILGLPVSTIWAWNAAGTGPRFIRAGKHVRYSSQSVQEWIAARVEGGGAVADVA